MLHRKKLVFIEQISPFLRAFQKRTFASTNAFVILKAVSLSKSSPFWAELVFLHVFVLVGLLRRHGEQIECSVFAARVAPYLRSS